MCLSPDLDPQEEILYILTQCRHSYLDMDKHTIEKKSINKITPTHPRRPELDPVFSVFFY